MNLVCRGASIGLEAVAVIESAELDLVRDSVTSEGELGLMSLLPDDRVLRDCR